MFHAVPIIFERPVENIGNEEIAVGVTIRQAPGTCMSLLPRIILFLSVFRPRCLRRCKLIPEAEQHIAEVLHSTALPRPPPFLESRTCRYGSAISGRPRATKSMFIASASKAWTVVSSRAAISRSWRLTALSKCPPTSLLPARAGVDARGSSEASATRSTEREAPRVTAALTAPPCCLPATTCRASERLRFCFITRLPAYLYTYPLV